MDYSTGKPNIFNFATTELSQDAFLCWLVSWIEVPESEMCQVAKDFITLLYNQYHNEIVNDTKKINSYDVLGLIKTKINEKEKYVLQQYQKIDVYFRVTIKDKKVSFIIEDKTHTSHHSDQLKKYKERIKDDGIHEDETVKIYFKTGYPYESDINVENEHGYYALFYEEWQEFLDNYRSIKNPFFSAYKEFFERNYFNHYKNELLKLERDNGYETFEYDFTQYKFLIDLKENCSDYHNDKSVYNGTSYGRPWTQYSFIEFKNCYGDKSEYVFYRLDWKKPPKDKKGKSGYYLSIRQYADINIKNPTDDDRLILDHKKTRLKIYQDIFHQCLFDKIEFEDKLTTGKKESEIACLHFDPVINTTTNILENIGRFHTQFVEKIKNSDL